MLILLIHTALSHDSASKENTEKKSESEWGKGVYL